MANKQAVSLYADKAFRESIHRICSKYHSLYKKQFAQLSLFDLADVEQEIWAHLFGLDCQGDNSFYWNHAEGRLKNLLRKANIQGLDTINFSDLTDNYLRTRQLPA